jgi:hypothetical protein
MSAATMLTAAKGPALLLASGVVVFGAMAGLSFWAPLTQKPLILSGNMAQAGATVIGSLLVVALILERALAAFNQLLFGGEQADTRQATVSDPNAQRAALERIDVKRERARLILGLTAGFFISAAGVRTLAGLVATPLPTFSAVQTAVDICLTAGLLAGGSNGLAKLVDVLKERAAQNVSESRLQSARAEVDRRALPRPGA